MCDYSLMAVPESMARQNEELVTHRFPTGSLGLASPDDVRRSTEPRPAGRKTLWRKITKPRSTRRPAVCAVCVAPGTRLMVTEIPARLRQQCGLDGQEEAVFTQISANVHQYRDAIRFVGGREVQLPSWAKVRRAVKARDAYDTHLLKGLGATLSPNLRAHLPSTVLANEIDSNTILNRIDRIDVDLCLLELKPILPPDVYAALEDAGFEPLRDALTELYEEWL